MSLANPIRVLVLHGDAFTRAGLTATFSRYRDLQVVNMEEEFEGEPSHPAKRHVADVVVTDYEHGIQIADRRSRNDGGTDGSKVMIVTSTDRECEIRNAIQCGVRGYVLFGCELDDLALGVREVHRGVRFLSPQVAQRLAESLSADKLTSREEEVLQLVVEGLGNKMIARRLGIALGTVKSHLKGIFDKLSVDSRTQAICVAERRGLLREAGPEAEVSPVVVEAPRMPTFTQDYLFETTRAVCAPVSV